MSSRIGSLPRTTARRRAWRDGLGRTGAPFRRRMRQAGRPPCPASAMRNAHAVLGGPGHHLRTFAPPGSHRPSSRAFPGAYPWPKANEENLPRSAGVGASLICASEGMHHPLGGPSGGVAGPLAARRAGDIGAQVTTRSAAANSGTTACQSPTMPISHWEKTTASGSSLMASIVPAARTPTMWLNFPLKPTAT